jgi:polar amino acid transport system permease protein
MTYVFQFGEVFHYWTWLLQGLVVTLAYAIVGMGLSVALGTLGALCRRSRYRLPRLLARVYVQTIRNTPLLVQLFVLFFGLPTIGIRLGAYLAAMVGIVIYNGAFLTETIRAGLQAIHPSQIEAGLSIGMSRRQVFIHVVLKPALEKVYPTLTSQFIRNGSGSTTLLGAGRLVPDVVGDGRGWHGEARFADKGCSYD